MNDIPLLRLRWYSGILAILSAILPVSSLLAQSKLEPYGLDGLRVTDVAVHGSALYAAVDTAGIFRRDVGSPDSGWTALGLVDRRVRAVYPHDVGPIGFAITVGCAPDTYRGDTTLTYCTYNSETAWFASDSGMTRGEGSAIVSIDGFPSLAICGETFAGGGSVVYRKTTNFWEKVFDIGVGTVNAVRAGIFGIDSLRGVAWAGGETAAFMPFIARSTDRGSTWTVSNPQLGGDNACDALAMHPAAPDVAYAGMEGAVIVTTDGGTTWKSTGLAGTPYYFHGLAVNPGHPAHLFAGGVRASDGTAGLFESIDAGASWTRVAGDSTVRGITSIVFDPFRPGTAYVGTDGGGVYRVVSAILDAAPPHANTQAFRVDAPFPNPVSRASGRPVAFDVAASPGTRIAVDVYDALGSRVARVEAGPVARRVEIPLDGLRPGVYYCRIASATEARTVRFVFVR